ncbi:hypothetical protein GCM10023165_21530 [Variovorax defluvii]|uniref:Uncharacterized protein n=1 Tax=Variovorax defluvii TaxID=913761 RepID=A0ABP8HLT9_9BURK
MLVHPHHASIQWLRALNHIAARIRDPEHRASALGRLIHAHFDVRLRDWPSAPETRTAMLVERLYHHASADEFKTLLSELFKLSGGDTPDTNARMFIDPRCIASSALGTIVRPLGFASLPTFQIIDRIVEEFDSLFSPSPRHRAKFWAELTVSHREPRRRQDASNVLRKLIDEHAELSHFGEFFEQAMAFLMKPQEAPHEHREAMITYLLESGTPLSPLSVELLVALAGLVHAREGQGLSEVQRTRLQPLLSQYMQAFNALHTRLLHKAREQMRRIPVRLLLLPFSQLDMDDKLKIVDVPVDTSDEDGEDFFYLDVQTFLPMIRSALTDNALPLQMRLALARKLLDRLKETSNEKALETYELHVLHASLSGEPNAANDFGPVR